MKKPILVLATVLLLGTNLMAGSMGAIGGGLGATMPQGEFNEYTKTGFSIMAFGRFNPFGNPTLGFRLGLNGVFFENEGRVAFIGDEPSVPVDEIYTNTLYKGTFGLEVCRRLNSFEPYAGAGIGLYYFEAKTKLEDSMGEIIAENTADSKTKFGWNLNGGLKIYILYKVALDFNIQYDIVQDLEQYKAAEDDPNNLEIVSFNSKFFSVFAGVSIPFGLF